MMGVDLVGGDLPRGRKAATNFQDCCDACRKDNRCKAFTFIANERFCYLKGDGYTKTNRAISQSGIMVS